MAARRPPLNRGHSLPTYAGASTSYGTGIETTVSSLACLNISDSNSCTLSTRAGEMIKRSVTSSVSDDTRLNTPFVSLCESNSDFARQCPSLPHSASPIGRGPYHQSYFTPLTSSGFSRTKSQPSSVGGGMSSYSPSSSLPIITSPASNHSSALLSGRSNRLQQSNVAMTIESTPHQYILTAPLGLGFSADSITITARKENVLVIVADRWDQEQDCHHDWQVQFGRDGDMSSVRANFDNGLLKITVRRLHMNARH